MRLTLLEDELLDVWREDKDPVHLLKDITSTLSGHLDFSNPAHDDMIDFATHLKLSEAFSGQTKKKSDTPVLYHAAA